MEIIFENKSNPNNILSVRRYSDEVDFRVIPSFIVGKDSAGCTLDKGQVLELVRELQEWLNYE